MDDRSPTLCFELVGEIAKYLSDYRKSLLSFSFVTKGYRAACLPLVFDTVKIEDRDSVEGWKELFDVNPDILRAVRNYRFEVPVHGELDFSPDQYATVAGWLATGRQSLDCLTLRGISYENSALHLIENLATRFRDLSLDEVWSTPRLIATLFPIGKQWNTITATGVTFEAVGQPIPADSFLAVECVNLVADSQFLPNIADGGFTRCLNILKTVECLHITMKEDGDLDDYLEHCPLLRDFYLEIDPGKFVFSLITVSHVMVDVLGHEWEPFSLSQWKHIQSISVVLPVDMVEAFIEFVTDTSLSSLKALYIVVVCQGADVDIVWDRLDAVLGNLHIFPQLHSLAIRYSDVRPFDYDLIQWTPKTDEQLIQRAADIRRQLPCLRESGKLDVAADRRIFPLPGEDKCQFFVRVVLLNSTSVSSTSDCRSTFVR